MGAGAVSGQQGAGQSDGGSSSSSGTQGNPGSPSRQGATPRAGNKIVMSCDTCSVNFNLFKRKKTCLDCRLHHCSSCLVKEPNKPANQRRCSKCHLLASGNFNRHDLHNLMVKDLRSFLSRKGVGTGNCTEKNDLIELALRFSNSSQHLREQRASEQHTQYLAERMRQHAEVQAEAAETSANPENSTVVPPSANVTNSFEPQENETERERQERLNNRQRAEMQEAETRLLNELNNERVEERPPRKTASIDQLREEGDIGDLTVRQLKEILATNFVDYKGCVEKWELVSRVKRLWEDSKISRQKVLDSGGEASDDEPDVCKVCMDAMIDCVLLECGHMVTCTRCGRRLAECPICRQYIVRVVHTFRA